MHHRHAGERHVGHLRHPAVAADDHVLHAVELVRVGVADGVQFAGRRVVPRVGGEGAGQRAVEAVVADGVEFVGEGHGRGTGLDHRPGPAGEAAHRRVRAEVTVAVGVALRRVLAQFGGDPGSPHPPVAVPLGLPAPQPHAVDHAIAEEPVVGGGIDGAPRVRAVAQPSTLEFFGDRARDRQVERRHLVGDRRHRPFDIGVHGFSLAQARSRLPVGTTVRGAWNPACPPQS